MPNLVEIKTEIFEEYDNPVEEGVSPGSPTNHEELDLQDDLEHAEQDQNCQPENHVEEPQRRIINPHPHIIHENSEEENETEDEVEEEGTNGLDDEHQVNPNNEESLNPENTNDDHAGFDEQNEGSIPMQEDQSSTPLESAHSVDENQSFNSPMDHQSGGDHNSSYQNQPEEYREEDHDEANPLSEEVDHFANPDPDDNEMENPIETDENGFSGLQITNVETAVSSENLIPSPTPSFEDVVSTSADEVVPSEPDKTLMNTHFDENQMQELESLEEMLSYTAQASSSSSTGPVVTHHEVAHDVVGHVEFDFAHFGVEESDNQVQ
jgi:hypothetical protein